MIHFYIYIYIYIYQGVYYLAVKSESWWCISCPEYSLFDGIVAVVGGGGGSWVGGDEQTLFCIMFPLFLLVLICLLFDELEPEQELVEDDEWDASIELIDCWVFVPNDSVKLFWVQR